MSGTEEKRLGEELRALQEQYAKDMEDRKKAEDLAEEARQAEIQRLKAVADDARAALAERQQGMAAMNAMTERGLTDDQFREYIRVQEKIKAEEKAKKEDQRIEAIMRDEIKTQVKRIRLCDGSNPATLREYLSEVELSYYYVGRNDIAMNRIVANTSQGPLKRSYEHFMERQANRDQVTWSQVKQHMRVSFLSKDETENLKSQLEKFSQKTYEGNTAYTRGFMELAEEAYPKEDRTPGDDRVLLNLYVKGLKDSKIVERLVQETRPNTLREAILGVEQFTADRERFARFGWVQDDLPEPMEVGAIHRVLPKKIS
jgi:hypothetical protein